MSLKRFKRKQTSKLLEQKLLKIQPILNNIHQKYPNVNFGGCGTFSYYLSEVLDKAGIENEIVYIEEITPPEGAFRCDVKFTHILLKTQWCYIDNNIFSLNYATNLKSLDKSKLFDMLLEPRLWNSSFGQEERNNLKEDLLKIKL